MALHRILPLAALIVTAAAARAEPPKLPAEALVLTANRPVAGRDPTAADPVRAAVAAGTWTPPKAGEGGWVKSELKDGTPTHAAAGRGYVYAAVESAAERVAILDAAGHSLVYVNGEPRVGDVYRTGYVRLPVLLKKGTNHFLFAPGRGAVKFVLSEPKADAILHLGDVTAPDLVTGEAVDVETAVCVLNAAAKPADSLAIEVTLSGGQPTKTAVPQLAPLQTWKVGFHLTGPAPAKDGPMPVTLTLLRGGDRLDTATLTLNAVKPTATRKQTFRSKIDGSVQYYGWVPAAPADGKPGLVLTLHGASVEAIGQAACFSPKPGLHVVAPTNRRPYGFDWEDWGRLDAMEVLDLTSRRFGTDPARSYLTGHSMGGHGTWHVGVTFPDKFAAVGPSAGWVSLASYGGRPREAAPPPERELLLRAGGPSDTLSLVKNLTRTGVYVLHGDQDDNVPVDQARSMRKELAAFHPDFAYFEQPGAGHWWGNPCVDWPPMFEFFARHKLPARAEVRRVDFRTAHPGVSADCHWLRIEAQEKWAALSRADVAHDPEKRAFRGTTENVARLSLDLGHLAAGKPVSVSLDGNAIEVPWPEKDKRVWFVRNARTDGKWVATDAAGTAFKGPHRAGPFKDAFRNRMQFVYGTRGTPEENAWALAKARYDAEQFWYRGNGSVSVVPDAEFDWKQDPDRNVILYGHADMNAAGKILGQPWWRLKVHRGRLVVGDKEVKGDDLACLFVEPRPGSHTASVGVVAGTGLHGLRLTDRLPYFSSGVAYPDWAVLDPAGVRVAGYFAGDWTFGETVWRANRP